MLLTNGIVWRVYRIQFTKPIDKELVINLDLSKLNPRLGADIEMLYLWCKEGWVKSALGEYHTQKQALSRYFLGAVILTDPVIDVVRRELRRISPDVRIESEDIRAAIVSEVIKREVLEGDDANAAKKWIAKAANTALRAAVNKKVEKGALPELAAVATPSPAAEAKTPG